MPYRRILLLPACAHTHTDSVWQDGAVLLSQGVRYGSAAESERGARCANRASRRSTVLGCPAHCIATHCRQLTYPQGVSINNTCLALNDWLIRLCSMHNA